MTTIEGICNQALDVIGYPHHIGNIYEGTKAARVALDLYVQTRDEILASQPWYFARSELTLAATGTNAALPWPFEFTYPTNAIRLWFVKPAVIPVDPAPIRWLESYDTNLGGTKRSILTTFSPAVGVFTQRVGDPASFPPEFVFTLVVALAKKMRAPLGMKEQPDDTRGRDQQRS
jgi:hypothetical protein